MIANSGTNIYLPYKEIEAYFSSIDKGTLGIHAPNATVKKAIWQDSEEEDIPEAQFKYKGWEVHVNGSLEDYVPATATTNETGESNVTPILFWAKPVPATEETAKYVDAQGNFFNILGGQFIYVDDPDTYGMFTSEEDAAVNMRLKKIGEEEIETA